MSDAEACRSELFAQLGDLRAGLLGVRGSDQHMQPMSHHLDADRTTLWFITSAGTDLVAALGEAAEGQFTITGKDHRFWASMSGPLRRSRDEAKLDEVWSVVAAAWFEDGRADPDICLLGLTLHSASVWTATGNPLGFAFQIARANLAGGAEPDLGMHEVLTFP